MILNVLRWERSEEFVGNKSRRKRQIQRLSIEKVLVEHPVESLVPKVVTARVPVAWMSAKQIEGFVAAEAQHQDAATLRRRIDNCKKALDGRPPGIDQATALFPIPRELEEYLNQLWSTPVGKVYRSNGYEARLAHLEEIVGFQTVVREQAGRRLAARARRHDLASIAKVALPFDFSQEISTSYDALRRSWTVRAHDPNLRVGAPLQPNETAPLGFPAVGFRIEIPASLMQVQTYKGRHYLSDGYHRAIGLLRHGISSVPVLYRHIEAFEDLGAIGHLPIDVITGSKPPRLGDYLDDAVSVEGHTPETPRRLLIHATELS